MNQNQCVVPSWGIEDVTPIPQVAAPPPPSRARSHSNSLYGGPDISLHDYEVTELTWENGQLTMHGLGLPRVPSKPDLASGTLESVVNQATAIPPPPGGGASINDDDLVPLFDGPPNSAPASVSMSMDALVPTAENGTGCSTRVGSVAAARVPVGSDWSVSVSENARRRGDTCQQTSGGVNGMTLTSFGLSLDTKTAVTGSDDHESVCHSRPQKDRGDDEEENEKKGTCKSSGLAKRSRAAAIHNQSERKRRDKINQRMTTLQKLVPNSNKADKASTLDEVIDYLKQLQAQVQMMNRMSIPSMMMTMPMPMAIQQQQLQMSMMSQMGMDMGMGMMGMGMGMGIDHMNNINPARPNNAAGISTAVVTPSAFMPRFTWDGVSGAPMVGDRVPSHQPAMVHPDPLSAYLACQQSQPMTVDAYNTMVATYQQLQQQQQQHQQLSPTSNN